MAGFRHVVMFTWVEGVTTLQRRTVAERLSGLPAVIPEIKAYSIGEDAGINEGNNDFVYRDHPVHRTVIKESVTRAAVQYEF